MTDPTGPRLGARLARSGELQHPKDMTAEERERAIAVANVPEDVYQAYLASVGIEPNMPTSAGLLEFAAKLTTGRENGRSRGRGYQPWRPQRKTRVLLAQVKAIFEEYEDNLPLSVRQVFYRLVGAYGYDKTEAAYKKLCDKLVRARRAGLIPFDYLRDDGVVVVQSRWYAETADFWDDVVGQARAFERDKQSGQKVYIELWTEASGMMPQLANVARAYSVPVYSNSGFASLSAVRQIVDRAAKRSVPTIMLHVGDLDPSGEAVFDHIAEDAAAFLEADRVIQTQRIVAERVALLPWQVTVWDLPTAPAKETDSRSAKWGDAGTCQAEALPPDVLATLVREAIEEHLDMGIVEFHREEETRERTLLLRALPRGEAA